MGIISRLFRKEQRAEVLTADDRIMSILRTIEISPETAREIPAVSACIEMLSSVIAALPVKLYRDNRQENITEEIKDDIRLRLLNDETGDMLDPFQMKKAVISDFFYYGGGYIYPEMRRNRCISLRYIPHDAISSYSGVDPVFKTGEFLLTNGMTLREDQVIRLLHDTKDGLKGDSFILLHQQLFTTMYREIVYEKHIVTNGGNKKGFLTSENKLDPEMLSDLRQKWNEMYANTGNTMMVLNKGLSFHESSNTSVEMQLRENKQDNNAIACQVFGLSPEAISGMLTDDQFASTIKTAATPIITAFENALDVGLLLPSERDNYYFVLDTTELTKGDILKRYQAYKTGLECNVLQIDEARYKEDLPPLGLNWIKLGLQDVLYDPKTKMIYTPNMNQSMQMSENPVSFGEKTVDNGGEGGIIEEREFNEDQPRDDDGKWTSGGVSAKGENTFKKAFPNKQKRNNHFLNKHKDEYADDGITTPEQYEKRALELVQSACSDTILGYKNSLNQVVRYDTVKNDFVKGNPERGIFTMFKPNYKEIKAGDKNAGLKYFNEFLNNEGIETDE